MKRIISIIYTTICASALIAQPTTINIDLNQIQQTISGYGAHIWPGDDPGMQVLLDLEMRFARLAVGPNYDDLAENVPTTGSWQDMYDFVSQNFNGDFPWRLSIAQEAFAAADSAGIQLILVQFKIPEELLDVANIMPADRVDDFANFWTALVTYLGENGMQPAFLELANEPNGTWNGLIKPHLYRQLVQLVRSDLDARGFDGIGIIGPGLSEMGPGPQWLAGLNPAAVGNLAGWSTHAWDDWRGYEDRWQLFFDDAFVWDASKEMFITEYGTALTEFNGAQYTSPSDGLPNSASESSIFAVRVIENTLTLLNMGASSLLYWEAADQPSWSSATWGLRRGDGTNRPSYLALETLMDYFNRDDLVITPSWHDEDICLTVVSSGTDISIVLANSGATTENRQISIDDADVVSIHSSARFENSTIQPALAKLVGGNLRVKLRPESATFLRLELESPGLSTISYYLLAVQAQSEEKIGLQNYPNPFNPSTTIRYELPMPGHVGLAIYDITGRLVHQLVKKSASSGIHTAVWNGTNDGGQMVPSGLYVYRLSYAPEADIPSDSPLNSEVVEARRAAGEDVHTGKMLLIR